MDKIAEISSSVANNDKKGRKVLNKISFIINVIEQTFQPIMVQCASIAL